MVSCASKICWFRTTSPCSSSMSVWEEWTKMPLFSLLSCSDDLPTSLGCCSCSSLEKQPRSLQLNSGQQQMIHGVSTPSFGKLWRDEKPTPGREKRHLGLRFLGWDKSPSPVCLGLGALRENIPELASLPIPAVEVQHQLQSGNIPSFPWYPFLKARTGSYKRLKLMGWVSLEGTLKIILFQCHSLDMPKR